MTCESVFTLTKGNKKIIIRNTVKTSVSLEGNVDVFSLVCISKIGIAEDAGTGIVEVRHVNILVNSPNRWGVWFSMYR